MELSQILALTCKECSKDTSCKNPCIFIDHLAGRGKGRREALAPPLPDEDKDYKKILIMMQQSIESNRNTTIKEVRQIPDINIRTIAALLYAQIPIKDIAYQLDKSERTIRRLCGMS